MALTSVVPLQGFFPLWLPPTLRRSHSYTPQIFAHHSANAVTNLASVAPPAGYDLHAVLTATPTQTVAAPYSVGANHPDRGTVFILTRQQDLVSNNLVALTAPSQTKTVCPIKPDPTSHRLQVYPTADGSGTEGCITPKYDADHLYFDARAVTPSYVPPICALFAGGDVIRLR